MLTRYKKEFVAIKGQRAELSDMIFELWCLCMNRHTSKYSVWHCDLYAFGLHKWGSGSLTLVIDKEIGQWSGWDSYVVSITTPKPIGLDPSHFSYIQKPLPSVKGWEWLLKAFILTLCSSGGGGFPSGQF